MTILGKELILERSEGFRVGRVKERPNRFVLLVEFDSATERVYLANPGALSTVMKKEREVLCIPVDSEDRKTNYDAFAIKLEDIYVTVNSSFANEIFSNLLEKGLIEDFSEYDMIAREPRLSDGGRLDFLLENNNGESVFIEVKSCTHVENGIAKFPDRPTKRGRRHLGNLISISQGKGESHLVFVVQRPDVDIFKPFREVDPEFAKLLEKANDANVGIHALSIEFNPPGLYLEKESIPVIL